MKILLLGAGGREHALAWKLTQSPLCEKLFIAPGNAGTLLHGTNLPFGVNDFEEIKECCINEQIDMVIVGPEDPLVNGIVDFLAADKKLKKLKIIGPDKSAARLEGSKAFAKTFMQRYAIPTAAYREFTPENYEDGVEYINSHALPIVIKADGLAAGKGVVICQSHLEAASELELFIQRAKFGEAGKRVVVEEFLDGIELSVFVLTDGETYKVLPEAKDYKRIGEGDKGLNTGGMGAISPVPFADEIFMKKVEDRVIKPTIEGLKKDTLKYCGFIFFGLIKVNNEPYVIEYNCRMGDPETEVVIPRLKNDMLVLLDAAVTGDLKKINIETDTRPAATVVAVSGGYPGEYEKDFEIEGLYDNYGKQSIIFQMGTKKEDNATLTDGGRVFCVTSFGEKINDAVDSSLEILKYARFQKMYYRTDIGYEFE